MKRSSRGVFDKTNLRDIGARIREARGKDTQEEFALGIGVGRTVLANYEAGRRLPDSATLEKIALAADVSANYLLTGMEATADPFYVDTKYEDTVFEEGYAAALYIFEKMHGSFSDKSEIERLLIWAKVIPKLAVHLHDVIGRNVSINDTGYYTELRSTLDEFKQTSPEDILELIITLATQNDDS